MAPGLVLGGHRLVVVHRQVGVLTDEQRVVPTLLQRSAQLDRVNAVVDQRVPEPDLHLSPLMALRSFGTRSASARSAPRCVGW
jgi:hypothetical protein